MPFSIEWEGADELLRKMDKLPEKAAKIAAEALYEGAGVMADSVSEAVHGIATEEFHYASGGRKRLPSPEEKAIVEGAKHGIAKFKNDGTVIQTSIGFDNSGYANESYADSYGNVIGSASNDTLNEISFTAIKALDFGEVSSLITGDDSDRAAYVAVYQRLPIEEEFACGKGTISETLFSVPYVGASVNTPYFTRYTLMTESYAQNMACTPVSEKVYDRIAINTLY